MPTLTPQQSQQFQSQINQIQAGINDIKKNGETPSTSGFKINVPNKIPSSVLGTNITKNDVFSSRDALQKAFETYQSQSSGLQGQITAALAPSEAESAAERSLLEKTQGYRQGLANIENKPIAMEFITGQSAALQKQASLDLLASSEALQSLTNKRKGVLESLTTQLGFQKQNFEDILGISKEFRSIAKEDKDSARQDMQDIVSFAQGKTFDQLDPQTQSKLTEIAANSGLTLDIIKQGLSNAKIAYDEARTKSGLEIQKLRNDLSPSGKLDTQVVEVNGKKFLINSQTGATISELGLDNSINPTSTSIINPATGKQDPTSNLASIASATGLKTNEKVQSIIGVVSALQNFADENSSGKFPGLGIVRGGKFTLGPKGQSNQTAAEAVNLIVQQWASGAALTEAQTKQVEKFTPRPSDTDKQVKQKINSLTNFMLTQAKSQFAAQGFNYNPPKINFFQDVGKLSNQDLLNTIPGGSSGVDNSSFFSQY